MIAIIGTFLGGLVGAFVVLVAQPARSDRSA
jgi:gas vesicle protein